MSNVRDLVRLCRPRQWVKNVFVLAPLFFSGAVLDPAARLAAGLAVVSFCAISSAVYIFNDTIDRAADRLHPRKCLRPLAAGRISPGAACLLGAGLLAVGLGLASQLPERFPLFARLYVANSLLYCLLLRSWMILDVISIALGFVVRVFAGCAAVGVEPSVWIIGCGFSLALTLALGKRRAELARCGTEARPALAGYDAATLDAMLAASTAITLLAYALYTVAPDTVALHGTFHLVYTVPPVAYGLWRFMVQARAGTADGPTEILLSDRVFAMTGLCWIVVVGVVLYWPGS